MTACRKYNCDRDIFFVAIMRCTRITAMEQWYLDDDIGTKQRLELDRRGSEFFA